MKLAAFLSVGLTAAACAMPAAAEPIEIFNNRPFISLTVNGRPVTALLDSAAEMTILDPALATRLGLNGDGDATAHGSGAEALQARFAEHVAIRAVGVSLDQQVAILDLGEVSRRLLARPVEMLIGRDLFDHGRFRVDLEGRSIDLLGPSATPSGQKLRLTDERGIPVFPASVNGGAPASTAFDLGNGSEVLIGRAYATRIGLTAPEHIVQHRSPGGGLGGEVSRDIVLIDDLEIAGRHFPHVRAAIDDGETATDLNVGVDILRYFVITTDFPNHAIWLEPRP